MNGLEPGVSEPTGIQLGDRVDPPRIHGGMVYSFILYGHQNAARMLAYMETAGIQLLGSYNEGASINIVAKFPPGSLRKFKDDLPTGWFKKVA